MRAPKRKRPLPRTVSPKPPEGVNLSQLAEKATYTGSPEHKTYPSFAGSPLPRADASKCDASFKNRRLDIEKCLREAIRAGKVGEPWENNFPRYVWSYLDGVRYEARLVNSGNGQYKGYPLSEDGEWPEGL